MHGAPGCGKTLLADHLAALVAQTHPVLYLAAEAPLTTLRRIRAWETLNGQRAGNLVVVREPVNLLDSAEVKILIDDCQNWHPPLVILDTLACSMAGGDENSPRDMGLLLSAAKRIQHQLDATVLFLHHPGKVGDDERGHSSLRGACDAMLLVKRKGDEVTVSSSKLRDGEPFAPLHFRITEASPGIALKPLDPDDKPSTQAEIPELQRQFLHLIQQKPGGIWRKEILDTTHEPEPTADRHLSRMIKAGWVTSIRGLYQVTASGLALGA